MRHRVRLALQTTPDTEESLLWHVRVVAYRVTMTLWKILVYFIGFLAIHVKESILKKVVVPEWSN
jgi:hypothetical protein